MEDVKKIEYDMMQAIPEGMLAFPPQNLKIPAPLKQRIKSTIAHLLQHDFERLLQLMYLIDVKEEKFKNALSTDDPAAAISEITINRLLLKLYYRNKYNPSKN